MRALLVAALAGLCGTFPAAADATFPGRDGRLAAVYSISREVDVADQRLVTMDAHGRERRVVYRCSACGLSRLAWSPTGRRIAWSHGDALFVSLAAGGVQDRLPSAAGHDPAWRPDNGGLVYATGQPKVATVDRTQVPVAIADGQAPTWCGDGTIAFVGYDGWLMAVRPDGAGLRRLPRGAYAGAPDCSPDSRTVVFRSGRRIYVTSLRGRSVRRIPAPARADTPVWSPSGRRLAWSDGRDIWIVRADGSRRRKVTRNRHRGVWLLPSWQPLSR